VKKSPAAGSDPLAKSHRFRRGLIPWLFLLPGVAATLVFRYYTIAQSVHFSLYKYNVQAPPGTFVGLGNYLAIFKDASYWQAWRNSLVYYVLVIALTFFIPIIQALFLSEIVRGRSVFTTLYMLPAVIPGTVNVVLWKWVWNQQYGLANFLLGKLGIPPQDFLSSMSQVKFCIIFPGVIGGGMAVLLYLAAILGVSEDIKEASRIDGCTGFKRIWYITLPNVRFIIVIQFIIASIGAFQLLDGPFQFTNGIGGPAGASISVPFYIYQDFGKNYNYGQGSAAAITLLVVIAIITAFQMRLQSRADD